MDKQLERLSRNHDNLLLEIATRGTAFERLKDAQREFVTEHGTYRALEARRYMLRLQVRVSFLLLNPSSRFDSIYRYATCIDSWLVSRLPEPVCVECIIPVVTLSLPQHILTAGEKRKADNDICFEEPARKRHHN